ncbi:MAG: MCE family protein [Fibrobacterota bacterium]|nr:MCE family protein [Fibrobacterota bacterium]QQS03721.1 MAG: MCE family protein [Fibrobacterota bacterium]
MTGRKTQNVIVGTVVLVALFVLIFGMAFLSEYHPGESNEEYTFVADQVGLLSEGDPVKFNGVKVGKVTGIQLDQQTRRVQIKAQVQAGVRISKGSEVTIQNVGLMGERMINIVLSPSKETVPPGATLEAKYDYGIAETMAAAGKIIEDARVIIVDLRTVLDSTINRPGFAPRVNGIVARADTVVLRLDKMVVYLEPKVKSAVGDLSVAGKSARNMAEKAEPVVDRVAQRADKATAELEPMVQDLKVVSTDIRALVAKTKNGESTLGKLANDDKFYNELSSAVVRADSLVHRIQKKGLDINVDIW